MWVFHHTGSVGFKYLLSPRCPVRVGFYFFLLLFGVMRKEKERKRGKKKMDERQEERQKEGGKKEGGKDGGGYRGGYTRD